MSVARIAASPAQAKVFVAMLQAEGIPARVDGDDLVDEFAAAQRLMNLMGTRVLVPTSALAEAQAILQPATVDADELTAQALAAGEVDTSTPAPLHPVATGRARIVCALLLALLFALPVVIAVVMTIAGAWTT